MGTLLARCILCKHSIGDYKAVSVNLSVGRMNCDKNERNFGPYSYTMDSASSFATWWVGDVPFYLKFRAKHNPSKAPTSNRYSLVAT